MKLKTTPLFLALAISSIINSNAIASMKFLNSSDERASRTTTQPHYIDDNVAVSSDIFNNTIIGENGYVDIYASTSKNIVTSGIVYAMDSSQLTNWKIMNDGYVEVYGSGTNITDSEVYGGGLTLTDGSSAMNTTVNTGLMQNVNSYDTNTVVNAKSRYMLEGDGGAVSTNLTVNSGGMATIEDGTVKGATVYGEMILLSNASSDPDKSHHTSLQGTARVYDNGQLRIQSGADTAAASLEVANGGTVYLGTSYNTAHTPSGQTDDYAFNDVTMNGGNIVYTPCGRIRTTECYKNLTVNTLSGTGTLYMNTDIAMQQGDFLTVTGEANGDFGVYVTDTGASPVANTSLQIIQTGGGDAEFTLANTGGVVDVGTYEYNLVSDNKGGWYLAQAQQPTPPDDGGDTPTPPTPDDGGNTPTPPEPPTPVPAPVITPSTAAVLNMAAVDPLVFQAELSSVRHRLNETRSFSHDTHVWSDVYNTRNDTSTDAGAGFDQTLNGITLGVDQSRRSGNGVTTRGVFFGYSHSDVDFDRGGDGNVDSYSVGAYASYLHDSGVYLDGILKANRFENDVNGRMTSGGAADGYYDSNGLGIHLEGGKYFHFGETYIAPYAAFTAFTTDNSEYTLSNGMYAHVGNGRSVQAEAGVNVGHRFTLKNGATLQPYFGAAVTQEFIDENEVDVNSDGHFQNDTSGTRGVYQAGLRAQFSPRLTAHIDASYAEGSHIESPWIANAGIAWSF
ncbi:autotransporter outer membrane beta-barrel domain-containing protein [Klebsiella aerogenes]